MSEHKVSDEANDKIKVFKEADDAFKKEWEVFETANATALAQLEKLRDDRNAKLDEAKRFLRAETERITDMRLTYTAGPFKVQKKWSDYYIPDKLVSMLKDRGLLDAALGHGIVVMKTEVAKYPVVKKFLEDNNVAKEFECCEDGEEDSTAIGGAKQIPPFAAELKKE